MKLGKTHLLPSTLHSPLNGLNLLCTQLSSGSVCMVKAVVVIPPKEGSHDTVCSTSVQPAVTVWEVSQVPMSFLCRSLIAYLSFINFANVMHFVMVCKVKMQELVFSQK